MPTFQSSSFLKSCSFSAYELWFKQIIFEIDSVRQLFMTEVSDIRKFKMLTKQEIALDNITYNKSNQIHKCAYDPCLTKSAGQYATLSEGILVLKLAVCLSLACRDWPAATVRSIIRSSWSVRMETGETGAAQAFAVAVLRNAPA